MVKGSCTSPLQHQCLACPPLKETREWRHEANKSFQGLEQQVSVLQCDDCHVELPLVTDHHDLPDGSGEIPFDFCPCIRCTLMTTIFDSDFTGKDHLSLTKPVQPAALGPPFGLAHTPLSCKHLAPR